ncbi:hypothetical protein Q5752_000413 [Cryptotrichosporon argae]
MRLLGALLCAPLALAAAVPTCNISYGSYSLPGTYTTGGACRYTIKYGTAARWESSSLYTSISGYDSTALPPSCPQGSDYAASSNQSEDCLYATVYAPAGTSSTSSLPVFVWIHGGSYYEGSASAPGLDGSALATSGNIIVVVVQYRLGVLGNLPPTSAPSADPNFAVQDVVLALKGINEIGKYLGANVDEVTIGGQSSGAGLIRALWSTPSAKGLFRAMIMQSDPVAYGLAPASITAELQSYFYGQAPFANCSSFACLQDICIDDVLAAQSDLVVNAFYSFTGVPLTEPIRPTFGYPTIPNEPTTSLFNSASSLAISPSSAPLLLTTVRNEAGSTVQSTFSSPYAASNETWFYLLSSLFGDSRANAIYTDPYYALPADTGNDAFRELFDRVATDYAWRCAGRQAAGKWAAYKGKVWVAEWRQGASYVDNQVSGGYCQESGKVCHEDESFR